MRPLTTPEPDKSCRGLDGRIDDPNAGWKGRGLWATYGEDPNMFVEQTQRSNAVHIQLRPDPLAH